uniref:Uncharacterized protein n=1 Tax=Salix viminalis TaxID=40686 RepID=A0A6N2MUE9_SALVM
MVERTYRDYLRSIHSSGRKVVSKSSGISIEISMRGFPTRLKEFANSFSPICGSFLLAEIKILQAPTQQY